MNPDTAGNRLNILVVEDETMIAMFLEDMLAELGCAVVGPVGRVASAVALIEASGHLDGALLDVNLRGELAYPVADALLRRNVPFVFITGYAAAGLDRRYSAIPALAKPFPFTLLDHTVKAFASRRGAIRTHKAFDSSRAARQLEPCITLTSQQ